MTIIISQNKKCYTMLKSNSRKKRRMKNLLYWGITSFISLIMLVIALKKKALDPFLGDLMIVLVAGVIYAVIYSFILGNKHNWSSIIVPSIKDRNIVIALLVAMESLIVFFGWLLFFVDFLEKSSRCRMF